MATRSLGTLTVDLLFKLGGFKQGADQATRQFDNTVKKIKSSGKDLVDSFKGFGAALGAGLSIGAIVQATAEAEKAFAQLQNAVRQNAGAAGQTAEGLAKVSEELQKTTTYSDDAIQNMQALLLRFQSIGPENFQRTTIAVLDLASALGQDLQSTARLVGRALEDPAKGMVGLSRAGVVFQQSQKNLIKELAAAGQTLAAQDIILAGLEKRYEGAAKAARENFGGALDALRNAFSDLLEAKGGLPDATANLNELTEILQDPTTKQAIDGITSAILTLGTTAVKVFASIFGPLAELINSAGDLGARIDKALFNRQFGPELERRLFSVRGQLEETNKELERLRTIKQNDPLLFWFQAMNFELEHAEQKAAELTAQLSKGPQGPRVRPRSEALALTEDDQDFLEKLDEDVVTAVEKAQAAIDKLNKIQLKRPDAINDYSKALAFLNKQLDDAKNKGAKPLKLSDAEREAKAAADSIDNFIERLDQQRETLGLTEAESLRYAITNGEIAKSLEKLGAAAGPIREKLLAIADATSEAQATFAIEQQIKALEEQAATLNLTEEEALEYSITQGELSKQLDQAGESQAALTRRIREATEAVRKAKEEAQRRADIKSIFEETRTDAEKYEAKLKRIAELSKDPNLSAPPLRIKVEGEEQLDSVQKKLDAIDGRRAIAVAEVKAEDVEVPDVKIPDVNIPDIDITVNVVLSGLEQVERQLESIPAAVASVNVEVNGVEAAQEQLEAISDEAVTLNVTATGMDRVARAVAEIPDAEVAVNVDSSQIEEVITTVDRATGKTVEFGVRVTGQEDVRAISEQIAAVNDAEAVVAVTAEVDTSAVDAALNNLPTGTATVVVDGSQELAELNDQLTSISDKTVAVTMDVDASAVDEAVSNLPSGTVPVTVDVEMEGVAEIEQRLNAIQDESVAVTLDVDASPIEEVITTVDRATGKTVEFGVRVTGQEALAAVNAQIAEVSDASAVVSVTTDVDTSAVERAITNLPSGTVDVSVEVDADLGELSELQTQLNAIPDEDVLVNVDTSQIEEVITTVDRATGKTVEFGVRVTGQEELAAINDQIAEVNDASAVVDVTAEVDVSAVGEALSNLPTGTVAIDADVEGIDNIEQRLNAIADESVAVTLDVDASPIEEVITTVDRATGKTVEFGVLVTGQEELTAVNDQIAAVNDASAVVSVTTDVDTSAVERAIIDLPSGTVDIVVDVDADLNELSNLQTQLNAIPDEDVMVNVDASQIEEVITAVDRATGRTVEFGARVTGQEELAALNNQIDEVGDATATVDVVTSIDTSNVADALNNLPSGTVFVDAAMDGVTEIEQRLDAIADESVAVTLDVDASPIEEVITTVDRATGKTVEFGVRVTGQEELSAINAQIAEVSDATATVDVTAEVDVSAVGEVLNDLPTGTLAIDADVEGIDDIEQRLNAIQDESVAVTFDVDASPIEEVITTVDRATGRTVEFGVRVTGQEELVDINAQIAAVSDATATVDVTAEVDTSAVDDALRSLPSGTVEVNAAMDGVDEIEQRLDAIADESVAVTLDVDSSPIDEVTAKVDRATGKVIAFGISVEGEEELTALNEQIAAVSDATATVDVAVDTSNVTAALDNLPSGTAQVSIALDGVDNVRQQLASIADETVAINVDASQIEEVITTVDRATGNTVEFGVRVAGQDELIALNEQIAAVSDATATVSVATEVDTSNVAVALDNLPSGTAQVNVAVAGMDNVRGEIAAATEALEAFSEETAAASVTVVGVAGVQAQIATLEQNLDTLSRASARPGVELEGVDEVRAQIDALLASLRTVSEQQAAIGLNVTGVDAAIGQLESLRVSLDAIPETTTTEVQVAVAGTEVATAAAQSVSAATQQAILDQETLGRAVADAAIDFIDTGDEAADYAARLKEVEERLRAMGASEEAVRAGLERVEDVFREAGEEASKAFRDEAKRNSVGIIADVLTGDFDNGVKGILDRFHEMLIQMAAQAAAARIADSLFSGIDGWLSKLGGIFSGSGGGFGQVFGGIGDFFAGLFADGGFIEPGKFGIVGEDGPEIATGGRTGQTIIPIEPTKQSGDQHIHVHLDAGAAQAIGNSRMTSVQFAQDVARQLAFGALKR